MFSGTCGTSSIHALQGIALIVVKRSQILVVLKTLGFLNHVLAVLHRRMNAGDKVKQVETFNEILDLLRTLRLCHGHRSSQLYNVVIGKRPRSLRQRIKAREAFPLHIQQRSRLIGKPTIP